MTFASQVSESKCPSCPGNLLKYIFRTTNTMVGLIFGRRISCCRVAVSVFIFLISVCFRDCREERFKLVRYVSALSFRYNIFLLIIINRDEVQHLLGTTIRFYRCSCPMLFNAFCTNFYIADLPKHNGMP